MSDSALTARRIALGSVAALVTGLVGYAVYFDYRRRHDPEFRKKLERQKHQLARATRAQAARQRQASAETLRRLLSIASSEPSPGPSPEEKENYFLEQVAIAEQLVARGPENYVTAAVQFFKALRVYPAPNELLQIYQKTQPAAVYSLIMDCLVAAPEAGRSRSGSGEGAIIEEITADSPTSSSRSKKRSATGSDASSPNGAFVQVSPPD